MAITVVVPVGPHAVYKSYLEECLQSLRDQTMPPFEVIVIDDMARLSQEDVRGHTLHKNVWLSGPAQSWNKGVVLSTTDAVFLMGSDDVLKPQCLEACWDAYQANKGRPAWYNVTCTFEDGALQDLPNNAAMVTKKLWNLTGGFPLSAFAGPDALLLSIMMVHFPDYLVQVKKGDPLYWCRQHPDQETPRTAGRFANAMVEIRNIETANWKPPFWTEKDN